MTAKIVIDKGGLGGTGYLISKESLWMYVAFQIIWWAIMTLLYTF
ncbi:hypothetical protein [Candidatus Nitrosocosmicus arcticus]|uniref:Uncharacterized protein n=1 Tax=Candidatus Nitrosocosmicus arcticus TaxID=2035267 RepID=A0A557SS72_9ARCH|nr:hypothetical protein [Candidatus Nitrosocosmicus arcticus]TVP39457.1 hypothetical protein NARC_150051 [Candidatus Nitrosocosmicus arcticus]